jgi:outer membrane protein assembly factor BamB
MPARRRRRRRQVRAAITLVVAGIMLFAAFTGVRAAVNALRGDPEQPDTPPAGSAGGPAPSVPATVTAPVVEDFVLAYPTYLGGLRRDSGGTAPGPDNLDVVWQVEIGTGLTSRKGDDALVEWSGTGWTGQSTLVYEDGHPWLLIGGYDHGLRRIDAETGVVRWRAELDDVIKGTNTVYYEPTRPVGDRLVVVTGSRRGADLDIGDPRIAPLRAFSFATGEEIWRLPVPRTDNYSQDVDATPLRHRDRLIVALEPGYVFALDTSQLEPGPDGHPMPAVVARSPLLYTPEDVTSHMEPYGANLVLEGSPALLGDRVYVASGSGHVYGLDLQTLAIEWDFALGADFDGTVVVTPDGYLLVTCSRTYVPHGGVLKLDPRKPPEESVVWFFPSLDQGIAEWTGGVVSSVAIDDDPTFGPMGAFTSVDGHVYLVSLDETESAGPGPDGVTQYPRPKLLFKDHIKSSIATPALVGDRLVAGGYGNTLHLYALARTNDGIDVTELDVFESDNAFESTPLIWKGRVYVGSRDGFFYCFGSDP